jgi:hypothetical protein
MPFSLPPIGVPVTESHLQIKNFHGLECVVETPQYEMREGRGWMNSSPADYGYIKGFMGADGDEMDCYIGPNLNSTSVFVVDQKKVHSDRFDEHKCMIGYDSEEQALEHYMDGHDSSHRIFLHITPMTLQEFVQWLNDGDHNTPLHKG